MMEKQGDITAGFQWAREGIVVQGEDPKAIIGQILEGFLDRLKNLGLILYETGSQSLEG